MKNLFLFSDRDSFFHRLDPRPKIMLVVAMLVYIVAFEPPTFMLAGLLAVIAALWVLGGVAPTEYWQMLAFLVPMVIAVTIIQGFTFPVETPTVLFEAGPLRFTEEGALRGLSVGARLATMAVSFMMFSMTTTPNDVGLALFHSGVPYRFAYLATMGLRFLPMMQEDFQTLQDARAARGDPNVGSKNLARRMLSLPKSLFPLAATSMRESNAMATALELRGYAVAEDRTTVYDLELRTTDYAVAAFAVLGMVAVLVARLAFGVGALSV